MKYVKADLLADVVGTYDQTKTTIQGRAQSKTISGDDALGPPLNRFVDTVADTTPSSQVVPVLSYLSPNGRLFSVGAEAGGLIPVSYSSAAARYYINVDRTVWVYRHRVGAVTNGYVVAICSVNSYF